MAGASGSSTGEFDKAKGLFEPEYVNIFGVPFTFLPHETQDGPPPPPPPPKTKIESVIEKKEFEISWPNIIRIDHVFRQELKLDLEKLEALELDALKTPTLAEVAPIVEGKPDVTKLSEIDLEELGKKFRWQKIAFETASGIFDQMKPSWKGNKEFLLARLIRLIEEFNASGKIQITPPLFNQEDLRRRLVVTLNMSKVVQHMWESIIHGEYRVTGSGLRHGETDRFDGRHADLVYRQALRIHEAVAYQLLRFRQHLGGDGSLRIGPQ